jgi:phosphotransferase system enzyme I (PtsI)
VTSTDDEISEAHGALQAVSYGLRRRAESLNGAAADVLVAQSLMATDPALGVEVEKLVLSGKPAAWAISEALNSYKEMLLGAGGYMAERARDLDDIANRAVALLLGAPMPGIPSPGHPFVLVADDLAPADTATLDPASVLAIVTERGGPTSHTAILARTLAIPAVVSCPGSNELAEGTLVAVDGATGRVLVRPSRSDIESLRSGAASRAAGLAASRGPGLTRDGHAIKLLVNAGGPDDTPAVLESGADGIGLLRTEFMFLDRRSAPTLEEQRRTYASVFAPLEGRTVVVRTLDAGADKPLPFAPHPAEPNPALGVRGLRLDAVHPGLLDAQLQAIALAAADTGAHVWVMAPMVATPEEAAAFAAQARRHGLSIAGAMVEVPAAALAAEQIVAHVDFLSIGTNDLSQYTFAADRQLGELAPLLDPWQPALLRLVAMTVEAGRAAGKPVSVCGEAAGDPGLAVVLAGLGVTSLSMAASCIAAVRESLASYTLAECQAAAEAAVSAPNPELARSRSGAFAHQL